MKRMICSLLCLLPLVCAAKVYQYKDANGNTVFSDIPPAAKAPEKEVKTSTIQTSGGGFVLREAMQRNPVVLWVNDCGQTCEDARVLLRKRGVPYGLRNPQASDADFAALKSLAGDTVVPVLQVGTQSLKGFEPDAWHAALDKAGYPKSPDPTAKNLQPKEDAAKPASGTAPAGGAVKPR